MSSITLVIGDGHTCPEEPQDRWSFVGKLAVDLDVDTIVQIGDFFTFDSISKHNFGKRLTMEGQRYKKELEAGAVAYNNMMRPILEERERQRRNRKAIKKLRLIWIEGNHEFRAKIYEDQNAELEGMLDYTNALPVFEDGWEVYPYRSHAFVNGVAFTHVPMNGIGQPIGSKHSVKNVIREYQCPVVFGHSHKLVHESDGVMTSEGPKRLTATCVGQFFEHIPEYAKDSGGIRDWWSGLVLLHHLDDEGSFDIQTISLSTLRNTYG